MGVLPPPTGFKHAVRSLTRDVLQQVHGCQLKLSVEVLMIFTNL